jgi:UDP-N-acetylmuramate dehydrogenase
VQERFRERFGGRARCAEPLARHTSFRIGGPADVFVEAESAEEIGIVLRTAAVEGLPVFVLGGGTNLLVADAGVPGVVLTLGRGLDYTRWIPQEGGARAAVGAATPVKRVVLQAIEAGLGGLEFAEGIPGTVGGGLLMNAGAFGGDMSAVVEAVAGVTAAGDVQHLGRSELPFRYRALELPRGFVVTEVGFRLRSEPVATLRARRAEARRRRERSQPGGQPNAGSVFKNPPGDHAGRLIEAAGLKGMHVGQAQISERHANFFVNRGGARAAEVKALMDLAQRVVWERFQVWLEPEVRLVGRW